ncbi:hypothetical protein [Bradyrhizobium sp. Cp5.3]|uniref:hypothetical protein n=1 Tax=Bradyrhizobium sp. Cp5.3 TaxID=443598 RepID=UPI00048A0D5E|nr:hypothetical protein [Bradyrhizobium sp. Cp5.3]
MNRLPDSEVLIRRDEVVRIHLDRLQELVEAPRPDVPHAVQASLSLRFLFDGNLNRVAHGYQHSLMIPAPDTAGVPIREALFFACGGYRLGGRSFLPAYSYREPGLKSPFRTQFEQQVAASPRKHAFRDFKLTKFTALPCLGLLGKVLGREETVRYVANKCGGAHHSDDTNSFDEIEQRLTDVGHALHASGVSAVFLETLGTAALLMAAPAVQDLRSILAASTQVSVGE